MLEKDINPYYPVDTNMLFCVLTEAQVEKLNRLYDVSYWDIENKVVRLATTFSTSYTSIDELVSLL